MEKFLAGNGEGLQILATLIHERTGLIFENSRMDFLNDKLVPLMMKRNLTNYLDYYYFLRYDENAEEEWKHVQSALAVNETYFWREFSQIDAVVSEIVPKLLRQHPSKVIRIWHAACATGEEPYSMAIALAEAGVPTSAVEIIATDFSYSALDQARKAVYRPRSFRIIPEDIKARYFLPDIGENLRLIDPIKERVQFRYLNLLDEDRMRSMRNYDIIICRNVFIYFSDQAIRRVAGWFYDALVRGGYLFVAAAESLLRYSDMFELVEIKSAFGYEKRTTNG